MGWEARRRFPGLGDADTQKAAYDATRDLAARNGGGDISVHRGDNGQIRDKNTIAPAKDPRNSKG